MKLFGLNLTAWKGAPSKLTPITPRNTFRDVLVTYEGPTAQAMPIVRRLVELQLSVQLTRGFQGCPPPENTAAYDLLVINLLLPTEASQLVLTADKHRQLVTYLRSQIYMLVRDRRSPFWDIPAEDLYAALTLVLHAVENYTVVKPLWS